MRLFKTLALLFLSSSAALAGLPKGFTPLIQAVQSPDVGFYVVETLIDKNADIDERDEQGLTVTMLAAKFNPNPEVIYLLSHAGADINARTPDTGWTALFFAVMYNKNPQVVQMLLNRGADQTATDIFGKTAYDYIPRNPKLRKSPVVILFDRYDENDFADVEFEITPSTAEELPSSSAPASR